MAPVIGIVACSNYDYYEYAIEKHGGRVEELFIRDNRDAEKIVADLHGLLLPGGGDIDPDNYGEDRYHKTKNVNRAKDNFEISLFRKAIEKDIPVLGICRGIQIMNVAMGGSLYQDIEDLYPRPACKHDGKPADDWHEIEIEPNSLLMEIVGVSVDNVNSAHNQAIDKISEDSVNSAHHQAIKKISDGLVVTARSEDGIIEAMEYPAMRFAIGVQYHPERMWIDKTPSLCQREFLEHAKRLFEAFINAASR